MNRHRFCAAAPVRAYFSKSHASWRTGLDVTPLAAWAGKSLNSLPVAPQWAADP
jgi:hypothetical protein